MCREGYLRKENPAFPCRVIFMSDGSQCSCPIPSGTGARRAVRHTTEVTGLTLLTKEQGKYTLTSGVLWSRDMGQDMGKPRPVHYAETIMTCRRACLQCRYGEVTVASGGVFR